MKRLAAFEIAHVVKELQLLVGAKVDKIFNPDKKRLIIQVYTRQAGKKILHIVVPGLIYFSDSKEECDEPSGFATHLRKILANSRIKAILQTRFERIVEVVFDVLDSKTNVKQDYSLFVEFFNTGNIVLVRESRIIAAVEYRDYSTRSLRPGEKYVCPVREIDFFSIAQEGLAKLIQNSSKESIVKVLALDLGLSGVYAEELCLIAGINKNLKFIASGDTERLFNAIVDLRARKTEGFVVKDGNNVVDVVPVDLGVYVKYSKERFSSYNEALTGAVFLEFKSVPKESPYADKIRKSLQIIEMQKQTVEDYRLKSEESQKKAELIYENYPLVEELISSINNIGKKHSWDNVKLHLKNQKIIKEIDVKEKKVIIDLERSEIK